MSTQPKKPYTPPSMKVIEFDFTTSLLACSSNDNPYWNGCWEESEEGYWKGND